MGKRNYTLLVNLILVLTTSVIFGQNFKLPSTNHLETKQNNINKKSTSIESDKIWLNLHNGQGAFSQILIGFIDGATNHIDRNYDGERFFNSNPVAFYSICDDVKLAVQGRELRKNEEIVPLGIYSTVSSKIDLQITIDELQGQLNNSDINIILEDKLLNIKHDLKDSSYSLELQNDGNFDNRFNLIVSSSNTLGVNDFKLNDNLIVTHSLNQLNVKTEDNVSISSFRAFDNLGRALFNIKPNGNVCSINTSNIKNGTVLYINVKLINNQTLYKKILLIQ